MLISVISMVHFTSCGDNNQVDKPTFNPTEVDPTTIFDSKLGMPILPSDNPFTEEGIYLGRMLFYDPILSFDSSVSCASCHKQEHAFSDGGKVLSNGVFGLKTGRNTPPIFNLKIMSNKKCYRSCCVFLWI